MACEEMRSVSLPQIKLGKILPYDVALVPCMASGGPVRTSTSLWQQNLIKEASHSEDLPAAGTKEVLCDAGSSGARD